MWFYIKICQNQQFAFLVMCDVWYGRLKLYTVDYSYGHKQYVCGPLKVICGTVLALYRVMCGPVKVMCGTVMPINL